ncbi:hypothetical protein PIROE2DRAFT_17928 [Piromyces sp. E2]|nr:hypothetical protein PIROE2DRAFT_17928 [Piromyces sp. E2]|eukprot:OUM57159.1 hypothetical protein PIROE2DRAFT_17928 [Piromyces sp. E2]
MLIVVNYYYIIVYNNGKLKLNIKTNIKIIEVDVSPASSTRNSGPFSLIRSINEVLPYKTDDCKFIPNSKGIGLNNAYGSSDYLYIILPGLSESEYDKLVEKKVIGKFILGPTFVPSNWNKFPIQNHWKEKRFKEILSSVKSIVVHSDRVRDHLAERSNSTSLLNKFAHLRPCTNIKPDKVKSFDERTNDIILFEKYPDVDRSKQGEELNKLLEKSNKKEIQNFGVIAFTLQKDLVTDERTSYYIPELANENTIEKAYEKIMEIIDRINKEKPDLQSIAKINQDVNHCTMALNDLCAEL